MTYSNYAVAVTSWYLNHCFVLYMAVSFGLAYIALRVVTQWVSREGSCRVFTSQVHLEQIWTWLPIGYLLVTVGQSLLCLYGGEAMQTTSGLSLTVVAQQWYWGVGGITTCGMDVGTLSDSRLVIGSELTLGGQRLGTASQPTFIPVSSTATIRLTSLDVIHGWSLPALGMRLDCVPGRVSCINTASNSPGTYVGFCSELCGVGHGFMPINVVVYDSVSAPVTAAPQPVSCEGLANVVVNAGGSTSQSKEGVTANLTRMNIAGESGLIQQVSEVASPRANKLSNNLANYATVLHSTNTPLGLAETMQGLSNSGWSETMYTYALITAAIYKGIGSAASSNTLDQLVPALRNLLYNGIMRTGGVYGWSCEPVCPRTSGVVRHPRSVTGGVPGAMSTSVGRRMSIASGNSKGYIRASTSPRNDYVELLDQLDGPAGTVDN